jgi:hypothetical protein
MIKIAMKNKLWCNILLATSIIISWCYINHVPFIYFQPCTQQDSYLDEKYAVVCWTFDWDSVYANILPFVGDIIPSPGMAQG